MRSEFDTVRDRRCLATFKGGNPHWRRVYLCDITIPSGSHLPSLSLPCITLPHKRHVGRILVNEPYSCDRLGVEYNKIGCLSTHLTTPLIIAEECAFRISQINEKIAIFLDEEIGPDVALKSFLPPPMCLIPPERR